MLNYENPIKEVQKIIVLQFSVQKVAESGFDPPTFEL